MQFLENSEKLDIRGYINPFTPGETEAGQREGMSPNAELYIEDRWGRAAPRLLKSVRKGSIVEVKELHCLAPAQFRADKRRRILGERVDAIKAAGGLIREWATGRMSKGKLTSMTLDAYEQIASSGRGRRRDKEGRPPKWPTSGPLFESYKATWFSRLFHNARERVAAIKQEHGKSPSAQWLQMHLGSPTGGHENTARGRRARASVYFIRDRSKVKIGYSINPETRMKIFTTHTPLKLLATELGGRKREGQLHKQFAHLRVKGTREWFYLKPELEKYISGLVG